MNEKLQEICKEVLKDKNASKKFMQLKTPEKMYDYFKEKMPELTETEFDNFITEVLGEYIQMQEKEPKVITKALEKVSGGANLGKMGKQVAATTLAALTLTPTSAVANEQSARVTYRDIGTIESREIRETPFPKLRAMIKKHPLLFSTVYFSAFVGAVFAVKYFVFDRKEAKK